MTCTISCSHFLLGSGKYVFLYWNDHTIRQHALTGMLVDYYAINHRRLQFETVWLPHLDRARYDDWKRKMPWYSVPLGHSCIRSLATAFKVRVGNVVECRPRSSVAVFFDFILDF